MRSRQSEVSSDICAYADVFAPASISHSGAITSNEPPIFEEVDCFRRVTQIGNCISAALQRVLAWPGAETARGMEALGSGLPGGFERDGVGVPIRYAQRQA